MMKQYDYIIAGSGCAGLSLAYYLNQSQLRDKSILIIDKAPKNQNDRTWCFWTDHPTAFDEIVYKSWSTAHFFGDNFQKAIDLTPMAYKMIRGIDFYQHVIKILQANPNIEWLYGHIEKIRDDTTGGLVEVNQTTYRGQYIFNSIFNYHQLAKNPKRYYYQYQHFKGWIIETPTPTFHPEEMHLMDFRTAQHNNARFFYVLPFNTTSALVEYTIFSDTLLTKTAYDVALKQYIGNTLNIHHYAIKEIEFGMIPMTNHPLPKNMGQHILNIGIRGGQAKASTGYAFMRIQEDSQRIVQALLTTGSPFVKTPFFNRYYYYDSLILNILQKEGGRIKPLFTELFKKNPIQRVFNFLHEKTSFWEEVQIMSRFSYMPFLRAALAVLHRLGK